MKILMASHYFSSHKGGVEIVADALYGALADVDREMVWMAGDATAPPERKANSRAVPLPIWNCVEEKTGLPFPIPTFGAMRRIYHEVKNAEILILHDCLYLSNIFAYLAAKWRGIPIVIIQHISDLPNSSFFIKRVIGAANSIATRPMLSHASQVVFISETTRKFFARLKFKRSPKIIFNGVDTEMYRPMKDAETLASLRRSYGLAETSTVILFVGRFVAKKGIPVMKYMVEMRPEWTWVFAGWGPLDPSSWNAANVRVFTNLWGSTMAALYRCCDLLVLPSTGEGFPLVIQEALASGIPVICGAETLGADSSMLEFARGAEITVGDDELTAQAFINAIEESLSQDRHSEEDSIKRRAYAESRYSWHRSAERYLEIITRLVQGAAKSEVSKVSRAG